MKIRIRKNTIRYRLDKADMEQLDQKGQVAEKTPIAGGLLTFLVQTSDTPEPRITLEPFSVILTLPEKTARPVIRGEQTGLSLELPTSSDEPLRVLLEQDFRCLIPRSEEDANAFDNPLEKKG